MSVEMINNSFSTLSKHYSILSTLITEQMEEITKNITNSLSVFAKTHGRISREIIARNKMADLQIVFTEPPMDELTQELCKENADVESLVLDFYSTNNDERLYDLTKRCKDSERLTNSLDFFEEILGASNRGHYHLACVGLFAILDGILADATGIMKKPAFICRLDELKKRIDENLDLLENDLVLFSIVDAIEKSKNKFFNGPYFDENEPVETLNRNWLQHGRTHRSYTKLDFIKVLLLLDAVIILADAGEAEE